LTTSSHALSNIFSTSSKERDWLALAGSVVGFQEKPLSQKQGTPKLKSQGQIRHDDVCSKGVSCRSFAAQTYAAQLHVSRVSPGSTLAMAAADPPQHRTPGRLGQTRCSWKRSSSIRHYPGPDAAVADRGSSPALGFGLSHLDPSTGGAPFFDFREQAWFFLFFLLILSVLYLLHHLVLCPLLSSLVVV
jgi:hypothetical protein